MKSKPTPLISILFLAATMAVSEAAHYQIYLLGGQSNGNGRADAAQLTPPLSEAQTDVRLYYLNDQDNNSVLPEEQWINLAPGSGHGRDLYFPTEFGPEVSFGRAMADAKPIENIAIIKYTFGGSNLYSQWSAGGPLYATFVSTVQAALAALTTAGDTYVLRGMLWQQGEADVGDPAADNYQANLTSLISRVRTDLNGGAVFPFVIGSLSDSQYGDITTPGTGSYKVRQAQQAVAAAVADVAIAISDGFGILPDGIHFDHDGQVALGQSHATQMLALEGPDETAPQLSSTTPADGAYVSVESNLIATFTEPIRLKNGGTVAIRDLGPGQDLVITIPDERVTVSGNELVIDPTTDLVAGNLYAIRISATAVEDLADNPFGGIGDDTTWNFSTTILSTTPQLLFYEPFDYTTGSLDGQGGWVSAAGDIQVSQSGVTHSGTGGYTGADYTGTYGGVTTTGGYVHNSDSTADYASVALSSSFTSTFADGSVTWFSMINVRGDNGSSARYGLAIGAAALSGERAGTEMAGDGIGFSTGGNNSTEAAVWTPNAAGVDVSLGGAVPGGTGRDRFEVAKITWSDAGDDTIEIAFFDAGETITEAAWDAKNKSTLSADLDQSTFDTLSFTSGSANFDEIRIATSFDLVVSGTVVSSESGYGTWSGGEAFGGDKNGDMVANGFAFLLGAEDPDANGLDLLPTNSKDGSGNLVMTFNYLNSTKRGASQLRVEHSSDLGISDDWSSALVPDVAGISGPVNGVLFNVTLGDPLNSVTATISSTEAEAGRVFGRLSGAEN